MPDDTSPSRPDWLEWACPRCRGPLVEKGPGLTCRACRESYQAAEGVWELLDPARRARLFETFIQQYQSIRRAEGRVSEEAAYYRGLPLVRRPDPRFGEWAVRAASFRRLVGLLARWGQDGGEGLRLCDLGAGNCWLSNRLAQRGMRVVAVDLTAREGDSLACHRHYASSFCVVEADFDRLPFAGGQFEVVLYNASVHYSVDLLETLREGLRVLRPGGHLVIMDSPIYRNGASGRQMVRDREAAFTEKFGCAANALASENFLTFQRVEQLGRELDVEWLRAWPRYGIRWRLRMLRERLLGAREPASTPLLIGRRPRS